MQGAPGLGADFFPPCLVREAVDSFCLSQWRGGGVGFLFLPHWDLWPGLLWGGRERWGRTPSRRTPPFHPGRFQRMHHILKPLLTSCVTSVNSKGPP